MYDDCLYIFHTTSSSFFSSKEFQNVRSTTVHIRTMPWYLHKQKVNIPPNIVLILLTKTSRTLYYCTSSTCTSIFFCTSTRDSKILKLFFLNYVHTFVLYICAVYIYIYIFLFKLVHTYSSVQYISKVQVLVAIFLDILRVRTKKQKERRKKCIFFRTFRENSVRLRSLSINHNTEMYSLGVCLCIFT